MAYAAPDQSEIPEGAPAPQRDSERKPLTKTTRLPYLTVVALALIVVAIIGALTLKTRLTPQPGTTGIDISSGQVINPDKDLTPR